MIKGHYLATLIVLMITSSATASAYSISADGLNFIAEHEGTNYNLYNDPAGHCTIGVGHLVHKGNCDGSDPSEQGYLGGITNDQAQELLRSDVASAEEAVNTDVTVSLTQAQFDALVSFTYNLGATNFRNSDLLKKLNAEQYDAVPQELNKWIYGGGKVLPGLVTRRSDEGTLFQSEGTVSANSAGSAGASIVTPVTLTLYIHNGEANGPVISGAQVTGQDGSGNSFQQTFNSNGYVEITGDRGTWSFTASADGYVTKPWDQEITDTCRRDAFLQPNLLDPAKLVPPASDLGGINFTSIKLSYISVKEDRLGGINFDYLFKAQKAEGVSPRIDPINSTLIGATAFMTGLAVPNNKFWVNLAPWEPDRIIDEQLRQSEVGRIMLEADFQMKRDFSNYENPCANDTGKAFWKLLDKKHDTLVQLSMLKFPGEIKDIKNVHFIPVTSHWIIPDKVYAYINDTQIYIVNATLTINSEPSLEHSSFRVDNQDTETLSKGCLEELNKSAKEYSEYLTEIEDKMILTYVVADVNHEMKYEDLRDVYIALALAQWYNSRIGSYMDIFQDRLDSSNSTALKALRPWSPKEIWDKYVYSFENGEYKCWQNETTKTATGTITTSSSWPGGGVDFYNIRNHLVEIKRLPPEVQDQVKRAVSEGFISDGGDVLFGKRLHAGKRTSLTSGSSSEKSDRKSDGFEITTPAIIVAPAKVAENRVESWQRTFGGLDTDGTNSVQQTSDGGYIIAGFTSSYGAGGRDIWLVKTDSLGNKEWDKTFGGSNDDYANSVQQTCDGGYVIAGATLFSYGNLPDICLIKTDSSGNKQWDKIFGKPNYDEAKSVRQTRDGGYIIAGFTSSDRECGWLIKTDADGNKLWDRTLGADLKGCRLSSVQQTNDEGYILAGVDFHNGLLLIKTDVQGNKQWNRTFGVASDNWAFVDPEVQLTSDSGYIIAFSMQEGETDNRILESAWLIKTDSSGDSEWNRTFKTAGSTLSGANSVQQTSDGGYIIAGKIIPYGKDNSNAWLIKTDSLGNKEWEKIFSEADQAKSVRQTKDGGYIIAGADNGDFWLTKTDANGMCDS